MPLYNEIASKLKRPQRRLPGKLVQISKSLNDLEIGLFKEVIERDYFYEILVDGLPVWGYVGKVVEDRVYLFSDMELSVGFNGYDIVSAHIISRRAIDITTASSISTTITFGFRFAFADQPSTKYEERLSFNGSRNYINKTLDGSIAVWLTKPKFKTPLIRDENGKSLYLGGTVCKNYCE